jgi:hypothetical protein
LTQTVTTASLIEISFLPESASKRQCSEQWRKPTTLIVGSPSVTTVDRLLVENIAHELALVSTLALGNSKAQLIGHHRFKHLVGAVIAPTIVDCFSDGDHPPVGMTWQRRGRECKQPAAARGNDG